MLRVWVLSIRTIIEPFRIWEMRIRNSSVKTRIECCRIWCRATSGKSALSMRVGEPVGRADQRRLPRNWRDSPQRKHAQVRLCGTSRSETQAGDRVLVSTQTIEGHIAAIEASAREAEARLRETMRVDSPGPFARGWIAAPGPDRHFTDGIRREINWLGREFGCHTCGTKESGTRSGNFIPDHQHPTARIREGETQRLYPQCVHCSRYQGYLLSPMGK